MAAGGGADYSDRMNRKRLFLTPSSIGLVSGAVLLVSLTGCVGYVDGPPPQQGSVYIEPYATFAVVDDYVYYPSYECYYSASRHQYAYREGNDWVARTAPRGASLETMRASPSVPMNFHDSPANHHAAVAQQYPKNWRPPGANQRPQEDRKDNQPDGNNGK